MGRANVNIGVAVDFDKLPKSTMEAKRVLYKKAVERLIEWGAENIVNGSHVEFCTTKRVEGLILTKADEATMRKEGKFDPEDY